MSKAGATVCPLCHNEMIPSVRKTASQCDIMVIDLALRGTHNQSLAWFCTIDVQGDIGNVDGMVECR